MTTISPTGTISTPVDPTPEPEKDKSRAYVVLRKSGQDSPSAPQSWEFIRNIEAVSAEQAVRKTAEILLSTSEDASFSATLVAVVASRFIPVKVAVETQTQIKLA